MAENSNRNILNIFSKKANWTKFQLFGNFQQLLPELFTNEQILQNLSPVEEAHLQTIKDAEKILKKKS